MTKPVNRAMAVNALLNAFGAEGFWLRCGECRQHLMPGENIQFDHVHGHAMGGPHEYENLRPIHYDPCHKVKSKRDVAALAKVDRITGKTKNGPKAKIRSRPMRGKRA